MSWVVPALWVLCSAAGVLHVWQRRERITDFLLSNIIHPIKSSEGLPIHGPPWKWTDGQGIDKFLRGHQLSSKGRRYGRVYRIWSGLVPEIVITTPEDVKRFHRDSSLHAKSTSSNGGWLFHQQLGDCMGLINGEPWKRLRAAFHLHFTRRAVAGTYPRIVSSTASHIKQIVSLQGSAETIHIDAANSAPFPFMVTAEFIYGPLTDAEKEQLWALGQRSLQLMATVLSGGLYRFRAYQWFRPGTYRRVKEFERDWTAFNEHIYASRKVAAASVSEMDHPPILGIWEGFLETCLPRRAFIQTMSEVLFANLDVATHVLIWLLIYVASKPDVQEQLRQEMKDTRGMEEYVANKDTFLHMCFMESARLRPFTAFSIPESSPRPVNLGGFKIPANTSVVVDTIAINHNPAFWGSDSGDFKPSRMRNKTATELRYNLFSFGFGTRKCLGQYLGEAIIKIFLITVLEDYDMRLSEAEKQKGLEEASDGDTWVPLSSLRISLQERKKRPV